MKKITLTTLALLSVSIFTSCNQHVTRKNPDEIYEKTINNPEFGGSTSLGGVTPSMTDGITTRGLLSQMRDSQPKSVTEKKSENSVINEENVEKTTAADLINVSSTEIKPEVTEKNLDILQMKPVAPDEGVRVITISANGQTSASQDTAAIAEPKVEEPVVAAAQPQASMTVEQKVVGPKAEETPVVKTENAPETKEAPVLPMPASLSYKMHQLNEQTSDGAPKKEEEKAEKPNNDFSRFHVLSKNKMTMKALEAKQQKTTSPSSSAVAAEVETKDIEKLKVSEDLPPVDSANVGDCMAKMIIPGEYKEVEENTLVTSAGKKVINIPAEYKEVEEEEVVIPEKQQEITIPAVYKNVEENVLVTPGQKVWKKLPGSDTMQLVDENAVYKKEIKKVLVQEARKETRTIAALTKTVKKKILVQEASSKTIDVPAEYKTVKKKIAITEDKFEWMPVLCDKDKTKDTIKKLQAALILKGYDIQTVNGTLGPVTKKAALDYQRSTGYEGTAITLKTLESLGLNAKQQ